VLVRAIPSDPFLRVRRVEPGDPPAPAEALRGSDVYWKMIALENRYRVVARVEQAWGRLRGSG